VRSVAIRYWNLSRSMVSCFEFYDASHKILATIGYKKENSEKSVVKLEKGERIVGVSFHSHGDAWLFNFQFLTAKSV
jgi:hypothetical protein